MKATQDLRSQTQIDKLTGEKKMDEPYGDSLEDKRELTMQVMFLKIGGLPFIISAPKNREIRSLVGSNKVDILVITEVNINWKNIPFIH